MWLHRHPHNNSLVVFIHGIFGNVWDTWFGIPDVLQHELQSDPLLTSYDYYSFGYESKTFRQPPLDPFVIDDLRRFLNQVTSKYDTVVLICHSQGGLVGKLYIIKELLAERGDALKIDCIITLGTPHKGRHVLVPLLWAQNTPLIKSVLPFRQLAQLASLSSNIRTIKKYWSETYISKTPVTPQRNRRYIHSVAVMGAFDVWAGGSGAEGYSVDVRNYLSLSHPALSKARSVTDALSQLIMEELKNHKNPKALLEQVMRIRSSATEQGEFVRKYGGSVVEMVGMSRPELDEEGRQIKATTLLMDFLVDVQRRPLRCRSFEEAVPLYIRRSLGEYS
jgi:pimeloyl-ACP methyl ester carboxylesterase